MVGELAEGTQMGTPSDSQRNLPMGQQPSRRQLIPASQISQPPPQHDNDRHRSPRRSQISPTLRMGDMIDGEPHHDQAVDNSDPRVLQHFLRGFVTSELNKAPKEVQQEVRKATLKLASKIESLQKTNFRRKKLQDHIECLRKNTLPKDSPKVPIPYETPLWDKTWKVEDSSIQFNFKVSTAGTITYREAREQLHYQYLMHLNTMELDISNATRENLRTETSKKFFVESCSSHGIAFSDTVKKLDLDMGLDDENDKFFFDPASYKPQLVKIYAHTVEKVGESILAKNKEIEKRDLVDKTAKEQILKAGPENLFKKALDERVDSRLKEILASKGKNGKGVSNGRPSRSAPDSLPKGYDYSRMAADTMISGTVPTELETYECQKNGSSPIVRMGGTKAPQSRQQKTKAKEQKGKGKSRGKGSPKGKGKGKSTGKGQSKGKGKQNSAQKGGKGKPKGGKNGKKKGSGKSKTGSWEPWGKGKSS